MKVSKQMQSLHGTMMTTGKRMCAEAKKLYPIGSKWRVEIATGSIIDVWVIDHSQSYWSRPGEVIVRNLATGSRRVFIPHFHKHEAL